LSSIPPAVAETSAISGSRSYRVFRERLRVERVRAWVFGFAVDGVLRLRLRAGRSATAACCFPRACIFWYPFGRLRRVPTADSIAETAVPSAFPTACAALATIVVFEVPRVRLRFAAIAPPDGSAP
jgi:hypothetical protein